MKKNNPNRRIILHHDNASFHTARKTTEYLNGENVELLDHPPYRPDIATLTTRLSNISKIFQKTVTFSFPKKKVLES
ncbi:hypothetical protein MSG28_011571 [Choristoneura fumiferana]|uniref:Uncharacterized protein n=1 Tax=Choristoneura fumiferana TaxID=7141 RepID=A0ACC0JNW5_CHOFU|nr:hypothetical protein MSG28_011571 [Choristoneura fumiferana]